MAYTHTPQNPHGEESRQGLCNLKQQKKFKFSSNPSLWIITAWYDNCCSSLDWKAAHKAIGFAHDQEQDNTALPPGHPHQELKIQGKADHYVLSPSQSQAVSVAALWQASLLHQGTDAEAEMLSFLSRAIHTRNT